VLLREGISQAAVNAFRQAGYSLVDCRATSLTGPALHEAIAALDRTRQPLSGAGR